MLHGHPSIPAYRPYLFGREHTRIKVLGGCGGQPYRSPLRIPTDDPLWQPELRNGAREQQASRIAAIIAYVDSHDLSNEDKEASIAESIANGQVYRDRGRPMSENMPVCPCGARCKRKSRIFCSRGCQLKHFAARRGD
jgi:hypothetical protein